MDNPQSEHLNSLKEIAAYLDCSTRTVQRWEKERGLPVRRLPGERGGVYAIKSELDAWKRSDSAAGSAQEAASDHYQRPRHVSFVWAAAAGLLVGGLAVAAWARWPRVEAQSDARRPGMIEPAAGGFVGATDRRRGGLNSGPWPVLGHDSRRTHRSPFAGPSKTPSVRLFADAKDRIGAGTIPAHHDDIVVGAGGNMYFGTCGDVRGLDPKGQQIFSRPLGRDRLREGVTGIALDVDERLVMGIHDCPDDINTRRVNVLSLLRDGTDAWAFLQPGTFFGPAIADDGAVYLIDEFLALRAYSAVGAPLWVTTLGGYASGAPSVGHDGTIYAGTDASNYGHRSLWAVTPNGAIKWNVGAGALTTPMIDDRGMIYAAEVGPSLYAFTADGKQVWRRELDEFSGEVVLSLGGDGTIYARTGATLTALTPSGAIKWTVQLGARQRASAAAVDRDGDVYVSFGDAVWALNPSGAKLWEASIPKAGRIIIAGDGQLYVVSDSRRIYELTDH